MDEDDYMECAECGCIPMGDVTDERWSVDPETGEYLCDDCTARFFDAQDGIEW